MSTRFYFNRRSGTDRRQESEQRINPRLDLSHKRRRKSDDRRNSSRSFINDAYAKTNFRVSNNDNKSPHKH